MLVLSPASLTVHLPQVQAASSRQGLTGPLPPLCPSTLLWSAGPSFSRCPPLPSVSFLCLGSGANWELGREAAVSLERGPLEPLAISPFGSKGSVLKGSEWGFVD